ncbi:MAG: GNAT family N-acetyltransferase [Lachnospira sp.]|nr:GNAT family N-acetyltransferase [Lachnospira sp.]
MSELSVTLRPAAPHDIPEAIAIWNEVVDEGGSFPYTRHISAGEFTRMISDADTVCTVAASPDGHVLGLYILHPNIPGRCSSGANATYLVDAAHRGRHLGEALVLDSIQTARNQHYRYMIFNGVVDSNIHARHLYARCGFREIGVIPGGFQVRDGSYKDMHILYLSLTN